MEKRNKNFLFFASIFALFSALGVLATNYVSDLSANDKKNFNQDEKVILSAGQNNGDNYCAVDESEENSDYLFVGCNGFF